MEPEQFFREKGKWANRTEGVSFFLYPIAQKPEYELVIAKDSLPFYEEEHNPKMASLLVPGLGCVVHALVASWLDENQSVAEEQGIIIGARSISAFLDVLSYSDAHNPQLWRRSMVVRKKSPATWYSLASLNERGIISDDRLRKLYAYARKGDPQSVSCEIQKCYRGFTGQSYGEFIRSQLMTVQDLSKKKAA